MKVKLVYIQTWNTKTGIILITRFHKFLILYQDYKIVKFYATLLANGLMINKDAFQSKAHLLLADRRSNTYNLTLE